MNYSDYIIYVDESGDHGLGNISPNYPMFVLVFCIFKKTEYFNQVVPKLQEFKFKYWGHDTIILHEHNILKSMTDGYEILSHTETRNNFMTDLSKVVCESPFQLIATAINKQKLVQYPQPSNPYELSVLFCLERLTQWLCEQKEHGKSVHIVFESRGKAEDKALELEFKRICDNASSLPIAAKRDFSQIKFSIVFTKKEANALGLQLADLVARPIGLSVFRPEQKNQAFDIIRKKFISYADGQYHGKGLKVFPQ